MTAPVIIADDHPLFRGALRQAVEGTWPDAEVIEVATAGAAREAAEGTAAQLLLLDIHMADSRGLSALLEFRQDFPAIPVAIVSASESPAVWQAARRLGASGFIPKSADLAAMKEALAAIGAGDLWFPEDDGGADSDLAIYDKLASLTPAQRRILGYLNQGLLNKQIAFEMDITEATVKAHLTALFRKLGAVNRTQAVLIAGKLDVDEAATDLTR
ncbi:MAG: response regulator [Parasphingopyxis sp.]|uniref:response regulator n=1 Tax=Parasphingopyxis sp. TaxID=1920299 RepID=UPI003FA01F37